MKSFLGLFNAYLLANVFWHHSFSDIFSFHSVRDSKIIGDNDSLENKYLTAKEQIELDDCYEDWLMWY